MGGLSTPLSRPSPTLVCPVFGRLFSVFTPPTRTPCFGRGPPKVTSECRSEARLTLRSLRTSETRSALSRTHQGCSVFSTFPVSSGGSGGKGVRTPLTGLTLIARLGSSRFEVGSRATTCFIEKETSKQTHNSSLILSVCCDQRTRPTPDRRLTDKNRGLLCTPGTGTREATWSLGEGTFFFR